MRKILFGHPLGNPNAREAALALNEAELLDSVATSFAYSDNSRLASVVRCLPAGLSDSLSRELRRRAWLPDGLPRCRSRHLKELAYSGALALSRRLGPDRRSRIADLLYHSFDLRVAAAIERRASSLSGVYLYEDGAARSFAAAKRIGLLRFYDLPTAYHGFNAELYRDEADLCPEFRAQLMTGGSDEKRKRKSEELALADRVIVASQFVADSLRRDVGCTISVIPYGGQTEYFVPGTRDLTTFRALYVGRVGPRKGVHYLLQAWKRSGFPAEELELVGIDDFPAEWLSRSLCGVRYTRSIPHPELRAVYQRASVFVFPTLSDGFGLVLLEAMASGVPIIATRNSGAVDLVRDGVEGFLIPIRDVDALAEKLEWCRKHPVELAEMGKAARKRAEEFSWARYRETLAGVVRSELLNKGA